MGEPLIKGTGIQQAVEDVRELVTSGRISRDALEARLESGDLALLDSKVQAAQWYPNECHRRLTELLRDVDGGGRDEYVIARGAGTAARLLEAGMYQQVRYATEANAGTVREMEHALRLMISLSGALYRFGEWRVHCDPARPRELRIEVNDAEHMSEMNRLTAQGFVAELAKRLCEHPAEVASRREGADRVVLLVQLDPRTAL